MQNSPYLDKKRRSENEYRAEKGMPPYIPKVNVQEVKASHVGYLIGNGVFVLVLIGLVITALLG